MHASRPSREPAAEEISIEPGPPLQGLQRRILAQDPGLARDAASLDAGADALRLVTEQDVALLLLHAPADLLDTGRPGPDLAVIMAQAVCDVALLVPGDVAAGGAVLVPFAGHEHDWAALELGACLAAAHGAPLRLTGVEARAGVGARDASRLLASASLALPRGHGNRRRVGARSRRHRRHPGRCPGGAGARRRPVRTLATRRSRAGPPDAPRAARGRRWCSSAAGCASAARRRRQRSRASPGRARG